MHDQSNRAALMADVVLDRAARVSTQILSAQRELQVFDASESCSPAAVARMRQIDLGSTFLQGVGYVEGETLKCSSLDDVHPSDVGAADYVSATGYSVRRNRYLSIAPQTPLLLMTGPAGQTSLIHPALIFSLTGDTEELPVGVVGFSQRQVIAESKPFVIDWSRVAVGEPGDRGILIRDGHLIAWHRSGTWDNFSYAAVPLSAVTDSVLGLCRWFVPVGLLVGLFAVWVVRRLIASRQSLPALLRSGLRRGEIFVVYQPIVDMASGEWVGAEVLARWRRPGGEMVPPDVFIAIAEKHALICPLTRRVVEASLDDFSKFIEARPGFFLSLNISSADLADPAFPAFLIGTARRLGVPADAVHLEITEREQVDPQTEAEAIRTLRGRGFHVGIDDFGTGYSNLSYLDTLQLDYIKIDRAFVAGTMRRELGAEIVDHIVGLANSRRLAMIAEGVEHEEQRLYLLSRGVRLAQGWLFGKPMSRADFVLGIAARTVAAEPSEQLARVA